MELPAPDAATVAAVRAAAAWFRSTAMYDYVWTNGQLLPSSGAGPLWARFYELGTGRPIFGDRNNSLHYDVREISAERRLGYAWYVATARNTLAVYDTWSRQHP
jgi:PelA/Pel-15E family pectate lyase